MYCILQVRAGLAWRVVDQERRFAIPQRVFSPNFRKVLGPFERPLSIVSISVVFFVAIDLYFPPVALFLRPHEQESSPYCTAAPATVGPEEPVQYLCYGLLLGGRPDGDAEMVLQKPQVLGEVRARDDAGVRDLSDGRSVNLSTLAAGAVPMAENPVQVEHQQGTDAYHCHRRLIARKGGPSPAIRQIVDGLRLLFAPPSSGSRRPHRLPRLTSASRIR